MGARLQGKVAIVTGASNGIGAATARRLAEEGAAVAVVARRADLVAAVASEIEGNGGRALGLCADIAQEDAAARVVADTLAAFGSIDILVNNANVLMPGMLADQPLKDWKANFVVSLDAAMLMMREAYPALSEGGGAVVNVSSVCADLATPGVAGYSAAKAGLISLTRNAAIEWGKTGVRVNCVVPGVVMTPATEVAIPDAAGQAATARSVPIGRIAEPLELANAILFLASDEASYITGAQLNVDGGRSVELNAGSADWEE
jgi:meso-butanediol dehydrogenase/(S,S)-butanediol dehydrogenase/diacetyl reductase